MGETLTIATRGSKLALWQSEHVKSLLEKSHRDIEVNLNIISTKGDQILDQALNKIGDKGLFTAELEASLRDGSSDIAVHSLKDLESSLASDLVIHAVLEREDERDVLLVRSDNQEAMPLRRLASDAVLGTGSMRRTALAKNIRPDLQVEDLRGNVDTRVNKLVEGQYDAIVLAAAGLLRLGYLNDSNLSPSEELTSQGISVSPLEIEDWLPAACQGTIGIEGRQGDERVASLLAPLNHPDTRICSEAERAFLSKLEGGCQIPAGVHARLTADSNVDIRAAVFSADGALSYIGNRSVPRDNALQASAELAQELLDQGADKILNELKPKD